MMKEIINLYRTGYFKATKSNLLFEKIEGKSREKNVKHNAEESRKF